MGTPFDLHVLSTPPAFILSQDQTLNKMVSIHSLSAMHKSFIELIPQLQRNLDVAPKHFCSGQLFHFGLGLSASSKACPSGASCFLSRCLIYKVHAVFYGSENAPPSGECPIIIPNPKPNVNTFFAKFQKIIYDNQNAPHQGLAARRGASGTARRHSLRYPGRRRGWSGRRSS